MRWLVEVMSLGKTEAESLYVDAESWQKALQTARGQRGESAPLSGFSIELLDDGCRAVDPMSRLRYQVRRAPDDGGAPFPTPVPVVRASSPPASTAAAVTLTPPVLVPAAAVAPTPPAVSPTAPAIAPTPPVVAAVAPAPASIPPAVAVAPGMAPPRPSAAPSSRRPPLSAAALSAEMGPVATPHQDRTSRPLDVLATAPAPASTPAPNSPRADIGLHIPSQVIFKREHEATDSMPLTYREYVFLVPAGTSEQGAEALLQTQLELVLASLARVPPGKLVTLGVFDVTFQGKPPVPPLATLTWKDWRGNPAVEFPRRPGYVRRASTPPPPAAAADLAPLAVARPPQAMPVPTGATPAHPVAPPVTQHIAPLMPHAVVPPPASVAPAPPAVLPQLQAALQLDAAPDAGAPFAAVSRPPAEPARAPAFAGSPSPPSRTRAPGEDLIADLFEAMHDLHFFRDAVEGGDFCLNLAMEKIPSQAGMVHLYDIDRREFLVTSTRGVATDGLLLRRHAETDAMLSAAMGKRRAIIVNDATQGDASAVERYAALGGARSLIIAPVMQAGRFLGAIELLNPLDGQPFTDAEGNALTYIAEQFADFVAARGVVTDPDRIGSRAGPRQ